VDYIRGYFDGDSTVHKRKWLKNKLMSLDINTGNVFIDKLHGFGTKICYRLELYGYSVKKYKQKIGYLHPEKNKKISGLVELLK